MPLSLTTTLLSVLLTQQPAPPAQEPDPRDPATTSSAVDDPTPDAPAPAGETAPGGGSTEDGSHPTADDAPPSEDPTTPSAATSLARRFGIGDALPATGPLRLARLLPEDSWAAFGLGPIEDLEDLEATGLWRLAHDLPIPAALRRELPRRIAELSTTTGLSLDAIESLARSTWNLSVVGPAQDDPMPGFVLIGEIDPTVAADVEAWLEKLPAQALRSGVRVRADVWDSSLTVWRTESTPALIWTIRDGLVIAGSRDGLVRAVLDRILTGSGLAGDGSEPETTGLERHFGYREYVQMRSVTDRQTRPLVSAWIHPPAWIEAARDRIPDPKARDIAKRVIDTLQLRRITAVGYTAHARNGLLHDNLQVAWKEPRSGLLSAFVPTADSIPSSLSTFAPESTTSFAVTHVALAQLWESAFGLLSLVDENLAGVVRAQIRNFERSADFSVETDLLGNFTNRFVTMQLDLGDGSQSSTLVAELRNGPELDRIVQALTGLQPKTADGLQIYALGEAFGAPAPVLLGIGDRFLVQATSEEALTAVARTLAAEEPNSRIASVLATLPPGTISVSWSDLTKAADSMLASLEIADDQGIPGASLPITVDGLRAAVQRSSKYLGELRSTLALDGSGLSFRTHSPSGNLLPLALIAGGVWATEHPGAIGLETDLAESRAALDESITPTLTKLQQHAAELAATVEGPITIEQVVRGAALDDEAFVTVEGRTGVLRQPGLGYLWAVLRPEDAGTGAPFTIAAWPDELETGPVYAIGTDGHPIANELLAGTGGIDVLTPGDLYIEGDFTGSRTPGWRRLDATASDLAAELDSPERRAADRALYASILDAEKGQGDLAPEDLIAVLSDDDPRLVARAAYALGVLHVAAAIPTLGQLVVEHDDLDVRLRAIEALASFDDARTVRPAIAALDDPEERIRAIAARHLGGLAAQARPAKDALLAVVTTETPADQTGTDRVAALLALADLGDPQVLVAAALSVTAKDGPLEQALAWAFQELSPKLGKKEEATTLVTVLDHPSDMVRRYALQRLAELAVPSTATALERRLAAEDAELLPLVEVALSSVRIERDGGDALGIDDRARIAWERVQQFWRERNETERTAILGGAGGFALLVLVFSILGRRRRRAREAEEWASMVAPSDEVYDDEYAEYDEYAEEGYEGEYEDDGGEYAEGEYEEEWSEDEAYADEVRR